MKIKKIILVMIALILSLTLMGCPEVKNSIPQFKQDVDGELVDINHITYEHVKGTDFTPEDMVQSLIDNQNLKAIDYDQSKFIIGKNRDYFDISDQIVVTSFYDIWTDGDDANFDGVVDVNDEEYYGLTKTDADGNPVYDAGKIMLVEFFAVGGEMNFTLSITDDEGATTTLSGTIIIVAAQS